MPYNTLTRFHQGSFDISSISKLSSIGGRRFKNTARYLLIYSFYFRFRRMLKRNETRDLGIRYSLLGLASFNSKTIRLLIRRCVMSFLSNQGVTTRPIEQG